MIQLENVSYQKKKADLVHDLTGTVDRGDRLSIFGPNGAGKSTLMRLMAGIIQPTSGEIKTDSQLADKNSIGYIPQQLALFGNLTVKEHMKFYQKMTGKKTDGFMKEMIDTLGLEDMWKKRIDELSGGMKRKVNLAVGLIQEPKLIFLDEPFVGVDLAAKHDMLMWLNRLNERGTTIVFVTHDWQVIRTLGDTLWVMEGGRLLQQIPVKQVMKDGLQISDASVPLQKMVSFREN